MRVRVAHAKQKAEVLKIILSSIRFLGRQGLTFEGPFFKAANDDGVGGEVVSNFVQLLKTHSEDNQKLLKWMEKFQTKFASPDMQNKIPSIIPQFIQGEIAKEISGNSSLP